MSSTSALRRRTRDGPPRRRLNVAANVPTSANAERFIDPSAVSASPSCETAPDKPAFCLHGEADPATTNARLVSDHQPQAVTVAPGPLRRWSTRAPDYQLGPMWADGYNNTSSEVAMQ
jgi:hypothetical protein